jgi:hypothetical protein
MTHAPTQRQALTEARETYDAIYRDILDATSEADRPRVERVYARGVAAFDRQTATEARLTANGAEAFRTYIEAATSGDHESKFSWLMMMPRVVGELAASTEPLAVWIGNAPIANTVTYVINTSVFVHSMAEAPVEYAGLLGTVPIRSWKFVVRSGHGLSRLMWPGHETRERVEAANKQSTLALAA